MKLSATLAATAIVLASLATAPVAQAAPVVAPVVEAEVTISAPVVALTFDRVAVETVAAPVAVAPVEIYVAPVTVAPVAPVAVAPVTVAVAPVKVSAPVTVPAPAAPVAVSAPVAAPVSAEQAWANDVLAGVPVPKGMELLFTNVANCGAEVSATHEGGCTYTLTDRAVVTISPTLAHTVPGVHVLLHEVGHANGIMDECGAEAFAHKYEVEDLWSYPACMAG